MHSVDDCVESNIYVWEKFGMKHRTRTRYFVGLVGCFIVKRVVLLLYVAILTQVGYSNSKPNLFTMSKLLKFNLPNKLNFVLNGNLAGKNIILNFAAPIEKKGI